MWVVICRVCDSCGGEVSIKDFECEPSSEDIKELEDSIGGGWCITTIVTELNGEIKIIENKNL